LGNDGNLYAALADNQRLDVTPFVDKVDFYRFYLEPRKHRFVIAANGDPLAKPTVLPLREFCVGQKIDLKSYLDPEPAQKYKVSESKWRIDGQFINRIIQRPSPKSPLYVNEPAILYTPGKWQPATTLWWVDGGSKRVSCTWEKITFGNGQSITLLAGSRQVSLYRPSLDLSTFTVQSPRSIMYMLPPNASTYILAYGDDDRNDRILHWEVSFISKYEGKKAITQLANLNFSVNNWLGRREVIVRTGTPPWLDAQEEYGPGLNDYVLTVPGTAVYELKDSPVLLPNFRTSG
jgi:hypothetical protein